MRKIKYIILAISIFGLNSSCKKELESESVSRVTTYAVIKLNGDEAMTLMKGTTFTDPGIVAKIGEQDVTSQVKVSGTVDPNTPGVYTLTYTVINPDSFPASASRFVGVVDPAVEPYDLSGVYFRALSGSPDPGRIINVTKTTYPGLYINDNPGGVLEADADLKVNTYMFHTDPETVMAPAQPTSIGVLECIDGSYDPETNTFGWTVLNGRFGAAPRFFVKQL